MTEQGPALSMTSNPLWPPAPEELTIEPAWEADEVFTEPASGPEITTRWWLARDVDEHGNAILFHYLEAEPGPPPPGEAPFTGTVLLDSITWGEGALEDAPSPQREGAERDYALEFVYARRPGSRFVARAGEPGWLASRLVEVLLVARPEPAGQQVLRRWSFDYLLTVPGRQILLRDITVEGREILGVPPEPIRLRRFHYHSEWDESLQPEQWEGMSAEQLDEAMRPTEPAAPLWADSSELEGLDPWSPAGFYPVATRFIHADHDALPDALILSARHQWIPEMVQAYGIQQVLCSDEDSAEDTDCPVGASPYDVTDPDSPVCSQALVAQVRHNQGPGPDGVPIFTHDADASEVVTAFLQAQGPPSSSYMDLLSQIVIADFSGDGMDDLVGPNHTLTSPETSGWASLAGQPLPLSPALGLPGLWFPADIDGDGRLERVYPPAAQTESFTSIDMATANFQVTAEDPGAAGGLCIVPPARSPSSPPVWTAGVTTSSGDPEGDWYGLRLPFFGGPGTELLDEDIAAALDMPVVAPFPLAGLCEIDGQPGMLIESQHLAGMDHRVGNPWLALSGWEYLAQQLRLGDVNGDGCADASMSIELHPGLPAPGLAEALGVQDGFFSEVWYGDCAGGFVPAGGPSDPAAPRQALGAPFARARWSAPKQADCDQLPYRGLALAQACGDEPIPQPWAAPWCELPFGDDLCCHECGGIFADCATALASGQVECGAVPASVPDDYEPEGQPFVVPTLWDNDPYGFDPLLRHRHAAGLVRATHGPSMAPVVGGQWIDTDADGVMEWLQLCTAPGQVDPLATPLSDGLPVISEPATDADAITAWPLALHFPQDHATFGPSPGVSCDQLPARPTDLSFLGGFSATTSKAFDVFSYERPLPRPFELGKDHVGLMIDLDGDSFPDHVRSDGDAFIHVRLSTRTLPESTLVAITWPVGDHVPGTPLAEATGTSYLGWRVEDATDHPLLPFPNLALAEVLDATGHRVFQRFGCRIDDRRFSGCAAITSQGHRGGLFKSLHGTDHALPGFRWAEARYDVTGQLVDLALTLPRGGLFDGTQARWPGWTCTVPVPGGSFDGSLESYLLACASFSSMHPAAWTPDPGTLAPLLFQAVDGEPLDLAVTWPGLAEEDLHLGEPALPFELRVSDLELDPATMRPLFSADHGATSTLDDDRVATFGYGPAEALDGPRLLTEMTEGAGAHAGTLSELEYGWDAWSRVSTTGFGGPDGPITSTRELDDFGRRLRTTDADGVSSLVVSRHWCGGVTEEIAAEQLGADSPEIFAGFDASCDRTWEGASTGLERTVIRDGLGRVRLTITEPKGDQPAMRAWTLRSWVPSTCGAPDVPQKAVTDGETLRLAFLDPRGQTWKTTSCLLAGMPPVTGAAAVSLQPADLVCVAGTEVDRLLVHDDDGLIRLESDPFPAIEGPSLWTEHGHDSLRRPVWSQRLLGSEEEALNGSATTRLLTTRTPLHDGELVLHPGGLSVRTTAGPLAWTTTLDGVPVEEVQLYPDGLPMQTVDAEGRVTRLLPDGLRRPTQILLPSFTGADSTGATVTHKPALETAYTAAGRVAQTRLPDGSGSRSLLDAAGRQVGAETLAGAPLGVRDLPAPLPPTAPDSATRVAVTYDPDGDAVIEETDGLGRTVALVFPDGTSATSEYDATGRLIAQTDRAGRPVTRTLDRLPGGLARETLSFLAGPSDKSSEITIVDHRGNPLRQVDPDGVYLSWLYDDWGRPSQRWLGGSDPTSLDPSTFGELEVTWTWDDLDRLVQECPGVPSAGAACTTWTYDARGRIDVVQQGAQAWELTWSDGDELLAAELLVPPFLRIEWFHDDAGNVRQELVDGKAPGWTDYDVMGRPSRFEASVAGMLPERWVYDDQGRLAEHHEPGAVVPTLFGYHPDGALQRVDDGFGALDAWYEYDSAGRVVLAEDASGLVQHREYDGAELAASWWEDGDTGEILGRAEFDRDPFSGRLTSSRQAIELDCAAAATPFGSMDADCASVDDYAEQAFTFSPAGRELSRTDPEGNTSTWTWDTSGRLAGRASELLAETFQHDALGRVERIERGSPDRCTTLAYDPAGRLIEAMHMQDGETETESWLHDALGRVVQASVERNGRAVEDVWTTYDPRGLVRQQGRTLDGDAPGFVPWDDVCDPGELCFEHDELGRRTSVVYPDQRSVALGYAPAGLDRVVEGVGPWGPSLFEVQTRDIRGRPVRTWRGGDVLEELIRGPDGAVEQRSISALSSAPTFVDVALERDVLGRLTSRRATTWGAASPFVPVDEAREYAYDAAGWLTWEAQDGQEWVQTFDRAGNRQSRTDLATGEGFTATYGLDNRLLSVDRASKSGPFAFAYDALGRRTSDEKGHQLVYSPRGRLESVLDSAGNPEAEHAYGVVGARVREMTTAGLREFTYGPGSFTPWVTSDGAGDWNKVIASGASLLTLESTSGPTSMLRGATGSPLLRADVKGNPSWTGTWDSYGAPMTSAGLPPVAGWKGMLPTAAPGILYLAAGHRDYDPLTGTWLQPDPLGVDGDSLGNVYRFAEGDPVNLADPSGLCVDMTWQAARSRHMHMRMLTGVERGMPRMRGITSGLYVGPSLTGWLKSTLDWRDPGRVGLSWTETDEQPDQPDEEEAADDEPPRGTPEQIIGTHDGYTLWEGDDGVIRTLGGPPVEIAEVTEIEESEFEPSRIVAEVVPEPSPSPPHSATTASNPPLALDDLRAPIEETEKPRREPADVSSPVPAFGSYDRHPAPGTIDGANSSLVSTGEGTWSQRAAHALRLEHQRQVGLGVERFGRGYHLVGVPQSLTVEVVAGSLTVGDGLGLLYGSMFTDSVRLNLGWGSRFSLSYGATMDIAAIGGTIAGAGPVARGVASLGDDVGRGGLGLLRRLHLDERGCFDPSLLGKGLPSERLLGDIVEAADTPLIMSRAHPLLRRNPRHHVFPQEHRAWFETRGVDIDRYTLQLDEATHQALHYGGGRGKGGGYWNRKIMERLRNREADLGRLLSPREVLLEGALLRRGVSLQHVKVIPFR